jgi:Spondin_N
LHTYEVTITNLTNQGQPFTPPVVATHHKKVQVFQVGAAASIGVKEIAENGNLPPLVDALTANLDVSSVMIAASNPPPLMGNQSVTIQIQAEPRAKHLSMVAMLLCTNDGFTGVDAMRLPQHIGESITAYADGYDAGTEINTEDFADIVPPCPMLSGVPSSDPGTGTSNPALAENGVIQHHPNIQGGNDLQPEVHGWAAPVARITVKRIN